MGLISFKRLSKSFYCAFRGLKITLLREQTFRIHVIIGTVVVFLSFYLHLRIWEKALLFLLIVLVLILEIINTIFERIMDIVAPELNSSSEYIKDMMGGAVLISAIGAAIIGMLIFWPSIARLFKLV